MLKEKILIKRKIKIPEKDIFSPLKTFDCGQCFRFEEKQDCIEGVVGHSLVRVPKEDKTGELEYYSDENIDGFFDFKTSYFEMNDGFFEIGRPEVFDAVERGFGIRILRQDFTEALISFIISQNNNIPRIKKNIAEISRRFGEEFLSEGETYYAFPTPERLLDAGETGLNECKLGFRTKYILDASLRLISGEINEEELRLLSVDDAREKLKIIKGVGNKVADCTLLYGLGRLECVPIDVWMKKIFDKYFDETPDLGVYGGVLQQYLFYNERYLKEGKK
jgi:N-glycosylase/DNA lyase